MLAFKYGTMNSGKTLDLLRADFDRSQFCNVMITKPKIDTREGSDKCVISSRIGVSKKGVWFEDITLDMLREVEIILVDEAQFLTKEQVDFLRELSKIMDITCYGLNTNFKSELFEGSKRLFEVADEISKIESYCEICGREKAVHNIRIDAKTGEVVSEGEEIGIEGEEHQYISCCNICKN